MKSSIHPRAGRSQHGFTMMELMIALTIGLIVTGLIGGIYIGSKNSTRYQETTSRLQENARFATDNMSRVIRNAGYNGCGAVSEVSNVVTGNGTNWWLNLQSPVKGFDGGTGTAMYPAGIPTTGTGAVVVGTDAFTVVGIDNANELSVISHVANSAQINTPPHTIKPGSILVISDCGHTAIFQMTGPSSANPSNVVHNEGNSVSPGNCYKGLGASCSSAEKNYTYQPGATLTQLTASAFYIGASTVGNGRSLWAVTLGNASDGSVTTLPTELIEGVDNMQIEYGEDMDGEGAPNRYVVASSVTAWPKVITMRVSLLMSTTENNVSSTAQTYTYNGSTDTATDRRVRRTYTSVFTLRNRSK